MKTLPELLVPPSTAPSNLSTFAEGGKLWYALLDGLTTPSQFAQDLWVDTWLRGLRGGLVVESGAFDAEKFSNSLFLEVARGWRCLLFEPNPALQESILSRHRRCHLLRGGVSPTGRRSSFVFDGQGDSPLGGLTDAANHDDPRVGRSSPATVRVTGHTPA